MLTNAMKNNFNENEKFYSVFQVPYSISDGYYQIQPESLPSYRAQNPEPYCVINNSENEQNENDLLIYSGQMLINKYIIISLLGKGSFGKVVRCRDLETNIEVAIKILNPSKSISSIVSEINTLKYVSKNNHDNLFVEYICDFNWNEYHCIVFELLGDNLYDHLKRNNFNGMPFVDVVSISFQLVYALAKLSSLNIVHCDIKPENIALIENSSQRKIIKLIDFGSSCCNGKTVYRYIQSRFYRAPEVIMELGYEIMIDTWSVGCVIMELLTGSPIFPGNNELEQLSYFTQVLGLIPDNMALNSPKFSNFFIVKDQRAYLKPLDRAYIPHSKSIQNIILSSVSVKNHRQMSARSIFEEQKIINFVDYISRIFLYNPKKRIRPQEALSHGFFCETNRPKYLNNTFTVNQPLFRPVVKQNPNMQLSPITLVPQIPINHRLINVNNYSNNPKPHYNDAYNHFIAYPTPYIINYPYPVQFQISPQEMVQTNSQPCPTSYMVSHYFENQG
ncbi:hypothetical protein HZS_4565, partial [Henneguya salminicola]